MREFAGDSLRMENKARLQNIQPLPEISRGFVFMEDTILSKKQSKLPEAFSQLIAKE